MAITEAQKRASDKYHKEHKEYYNKLSNSYGKKIRMERRKYMYMWKEFKEFINVMCMYDGDTLTYEELMDKMEALENDERYNEGVL